MAKQPKTTPKRHQRPAALTRKQQSRIERERRLERYVVISAIAVGVAVVGVLAYGLISEFVIKATSPVAMVGEVPIRTDEFQARVRFLRANVALQLQQLEEQRRSVDPSNETSDLVLSYIDQNIRQLESTLAEENKGVIGGEAMDQLVRQELVRQEAARRGIAVAPDELQRKIELDFRYDRDAAAIPLDATEVVSPDLETQALPTPVTEQAFQEQYDYFVNELLKPLDVTEKRYRHWAEADAFEDKLREEMATALPTEAEQIQFRLLVVSDSYHAGQLFARLQAGDEFQTLVDEIEGNEETTDYVQEFEWLPIEQVEEALGADVAAELWSLEPGQGSGPIASADGAQFYVAEIVGHEVRPIEEGLRDRLADAAFEEWVATQRAAIVEIQPYEEKTPATP